MTEKLARRGLHIHTDYEPDVFREVTVGETMTKDCDTVPATVRVAELTDRITRHDPSVTRHQGILIVDADGKLAGIITRDDLMRALEKDPTGALTVVEAGSSNLVLAHPDEVLYDAAARMLRAKVGRLPVVARNDAGQIVGYLGRSEVMAARLRRLEEEHVREPGWMLGRKHG
jgi:signal-transduction protein with cAMP-binding, CBS, and nucleotidyltransferase domain